jgi:hypothetical protein
MPDDSRYAAVVDSLKATASELHARPPEEMNQDWADRMADGLAAAGLLAAPTQPDRDVDDFAVDELASKLRRAYNGIDAATEPWRHVARIALAQRIPAAPAARPAPFTDLTARLAAADAGWCLTYGDERADPAYIRWLARQVDAFEDHASPAVPAGDEAAVLDVIAERDENEEWADRLAESIARIGEAIDAQEPTCTCDATGAPESPHHGWCELNHPHHECDPRSCRFAAVMPAEEARTFGLAAVGCPDGATCHRNCAATCWRVGNCGPLSGVYRDDRWPTGVRIAHGAPDAAGVSGTGTEASDG